MIVDAHSHLDSFKDLQIPKDILPVATGYSHSSNIKNFELAKKFNYPFSLGIAPQTAQKQGIKDLDIWVKFIKEKKPYAVGEIGLDNHWAETKEQKELQKEVFEKMVLLAEDLKIPVIIHSRNAEDEVVDYLIDRSFSYGIMMHFYSGSEEAAKKIVDFGGLISVPPVRSKTRRNVIKDTPLDNLVIETDSPYVGKTIEAIYDSLDYVCEVKDLDREEVGSATSKNMLKFLNFEAIKC